MGRVVAGASATALRTILAVLLLAGAAIAFAVALFGLTTGGGIAVYFIVWWTVLFAVLPFAARHAGEGESVAGADPGAPSAPRLREKAIWTTLWADAAFLLAASILPLAGL